MRSASRPQSTYDAIRLGAAHNPDAPAIQFLRQCRPGRPAGRRSSYRDFVGRVTQAANMFHALGVGPDDVVSFLLPLLPDAFVTLFGAEAAGIANPVNPLLEPHQIAEILEAAQHQGAGGARPDAGHRHLAEGRAGARPAEASEGDRAGRPGRCRASGIHSFDELIRQQPSDRLVSGRKISGSDIAAYFHTGGTTGTPKLVRHTHANQVYQAWAMNLLLQVEARAAICCSACRCSMSAAR